MNKQCICPHCGRIAEVRRRSNGKRLRFLYCTNRCGGLGSAKDAGELEAIEQDHIGKLGEFPENPDTKPEIQAQTETPPAGNDWKPAAGELPEELEPEQKPEPAPNKSEKPTPESQQQEKETPSAMPWVLSILSVLGIVGGGFYLKSKK